MLHGRYFLLAFSLLGALPVPAIAAANAVLEKTPAEAATIDEFIGACDRNTSLCEYKMRMAVLNNVNTRNAPSICLNNMQPRQTVMAWLRAHPETHKMPTEDGLFTAYQSLYPCP